MMLHRAVSRARQRGFGLVEVALALLVGIAVVSAALMGVQQNTQRAEAVELATEEQLVFTAADKYYRSTCLSGAIPSSVTIPTLLTSGYLTRAPQAIWGASWSVTYLSVPRRAQVSATLVGAPTTLMPWISNYTAADSVSGATLSWIHNIRLAHDTTSASVLEFQAMYQTSNC